MQPCHALKGMASWLPQYSPGAEPSNDRGPSLLWDSPQLLQPVMAALTGTACQMQRESMHIRQHHLLLAQLRLRRQRHRLPQWLHLQTQRQGQSKDQRPGQAEQPVQLSWRYS